MNQNEFRRILSGAISKTLFVFLKWLLLILGFSLFALSQTKPISAVDNNSDLPNVVIIVIDTLRADRFQELIETENRLPFLSKLSQQSAWFKSTYSTSSWTASATASIFTSLYPNQHQVKTGYFTTNKGESSKPLLPIDRIPEQIPTLPSVLKRAGYTTFGVSDNINVGQQTGFAKGFDHFVRNIYDGAHQVNRVVRKWKSQLLKTQPYFLYLHYMDPHQPYHKRKPWYKPTSYPSFDKTAHIKLSLYDSEVSFLDNYLKALFTTLHWQQNTLLIITADHGEEFLDHGHFGHPNQLYSELTRVPFLIYWPDHISSCQINDNVSVVDLLPTLRSLLHLPSSSLDAGINLIPLIRGETIPERHLFAMRWSEFVKPHIVRKAVIINRWRYIWSGPGNRQELFDTREDPGEQHDISNKHPGLVRQLHTRLLAFERSARRFKRVQSPPIPSLSSQQIQQLRSLGYVW